MRKKYIGIHIIVIGSANGIQGPSRQKRDISKNQTCPILFLFTKSIICTKPYQKGVLVYNSKISVTI